MIDSTRFRAGNDSFASVVTLGIDWVANTTSARDEMVVSITSQPLIGGGFYIGEKTVRVIRGDGTTQTFTINPDHDQTTGAIVQVSPGDTITVELDHAGETYSVSASVPDAEPTHDPVPDPSDGGPASGDDTTDDATDGTDAPSLPVGIDNMTLVVLAVVAVVLVAGGGD